MTILFDGIASGMLFLISVGLSVTLSDELLSTWRTAPSP